MCPKTPDIKVTLSISSNRSSHTVPYLLAHQYLRLSSGVGVWVKSLEEAKPERKAILQPTVCVVIIALFAL